MSEEFNSNPPDANGHAADGMRALPTSGLQDNVDIRWEKFRLANGLTVIVHENRKAPVVTCNIWYRVGAKDEPVGKSGFAHLFEHLMFGGSRNLPGQYINRLAEVGATDLNGTTNHDRTNYYETVPTSALDYTLFAESDRMGHFYETISADTLELQRGVVQNEKRQNEGQPYGLVGERIAHATYPAGHPYAHTVIGSMEDIERATLDDVRAWFKKYYAPSNAVLVLAGDINVETAREKVTRYFGDIPPGPPLSRPLTWVAKRQGERREILEDRVPSARVHMVWNIPQEGDPEMGALSVAAYVLGVGFTSRLHQRLVQRAKVATEASAGIKEGLIGCQFIVSVTVKEGADPAEAERLVSEELQRFFAGGPDAATVERAKIQMQAGLIRGLGSMQLVADMLAKNEVFFGDPDFYRKEMIELATVTAEQVRTTAEKWLSDGVYVLNVVPFVAFRPEVESIDRARVPAVKEPDGIRLPPLREATLSNGIRVVLAERHELPLVECKLIMPGGGSLEPRELMGVAGLTAALMGYGAGDRDAMALAGYVQDHCIGVHASAGRDFATVDLSAFKSKLDLSLDVFADFVLRPRFEQQDFDLVRMAAIEGIGRQIANPLHAASRVIPGLLYGSGHVYANAPGGLCSALARIERQDLFALHRILFHPEDAIFLAVGDVKLDELVPKLEARFGSWRSELKKSAIQIGMATPAAPAVYLIDRPGTPQTAINACLLLPRFNTIDEFALDAVNHTLGGSFSSRINMNLREDKHWTYGAHAGLNLTKGERIFSIGAQVQTDKTAESMSEILAETTALVGQRPVDAGELQTMQRAKVLGLPNMVQTLGGLRGLVEMLFTCDVPNDYWTTYADNVRALDLDRIDTVARALIDPAKLVWVVAGDRERIEPNIRRRGFGDVHLIDADGETLYRG